MTRTKAAKLLAWLPLLGSLLCLAAFTALVSAGCPLEEGYPYLPVSSAGLGFAFLGLMILSYRPANRIGWLAALIGITVSLGIPISVYSECGSAAGMALPAMPFIAWINYLHPILAISALFVALPLLFPDGRFLSPGWRRFATMAFALLASLVFLVSTLPGPMKYNGISDNGATQNPFALALLPEMAGPILSYAVFCVLIGAALGSILSLIQRWRHSRGDIRQQLKWFAFFLTTAVTFYLTFELYGKLVNPSVYTALNGWLYLSVQLVVMTGLPLMVGIAVFKYRLYDIDVIIRRTLIYAALTGLLTAIYFVTIVLLQAVVESITGERSPVVIVISTLLIAALFTPLRHRIQDVIDRRFFRKKYNAQQVLAQFVLTARNETDLDALSAELVRVVQEAMQPASLSIWFTQTHTRPGSLGRRMGEGVPGNEPSVGGLL